MEDHRLRLALHPLLPERPRAGHGGRAHGYALRLAGGPALADGDPLLRAYGAHVEELHLDDTDEALQADGFAPGAPLRLLPEPDSGWVGVWDAEGVRRAGSCSSSFEAAAHAALGHGLPLAGVVLTEVRDGEDRRGGLRFLVHAPAFVHVEAAPPAHPRPVAPPRRRLVLFADGVDDVRWWDPSAEGGPLPADAVPVSPELAEQLEGLRATAKALRDGEDEGFMTDIERSSLDDRARTLWRRARAELGPRWRVGFLGRGMRHPVWAPHELEDDEDGPEIPF